VYVVKVNSLNKREIVGNRESDNRAKNESANPKMIQTRRSDEEKKGAKDARRRNGGAKEEKTKERLKKQGLTFRNIFGFRENIGDGTENSLASEEESATAAAVVAAQREPTEATAPPTNVGAKSASDTCLNFLAKTSNTFFPSRRSTELLLTLRTAICLISSTSQIYTFKYTKNLNKQKQTSARIEKVMK